MPKESIIDKSCDVSFDFLSMWIFFFHSDLNKGFNVIAWNLAYTYEKKPCG